MLVNCFCIPNSGCFYFLRKRYLNLIKAPGTELKKKKKLASGASIKRPFPSFKHTPSRLFSANKKTVTAVATFSYHTTVTEPKMTDHDVATRGLEPNCCWYEKTVHRTGTPSAASRGNAGLFDFVFWLLIIGVIIRRVHSHRMSPGLTGNYYSAGTLWTLVIRHQKHKCVREMENDAKTNVIVWDLLPSAANRGTSG